MNFDELRLEPRLRQAVRERGYTDTTDVQERTLRITLPGHDAAVQSQTGTGKTAAFLITIFERMLRDRALRKRQALIIVPTRELAVQIEKEARLLNHGLEFTIACLYGGVGYGHQVDLLKARPDILIATPGRLLDFSQQGRLRLKDIGILVIDEADRLFDMGFLPDIEDLLRRMPPPRQRQTMLFSATLNRASRGVAFRYLHAPEFIEVTPEQVTVDTITQELFHVKSHIKLNLILGLLRSESPKNALIFANTRHGVSRLARRLHINGFSSRHLTGELPQKSRLQVINDFMDGRFNILVATDVAARGLQIDDLEMVINYDIPQDCENYVHRIGRTARAGKTGKAISLAGEGTAEHLLAIENYIGMKIPVRTADIELYARDESVGVDPDQFSRGGPGPKKGRNRDRRSGARPGRRPSFARQGIPPPSARSDHARPG